VLIVEFMQQGTTITSEVYCNEKQHRAIQAWNADSSCSAPL
jgi:hypothetical protein